MFYRRVNFSKVLHNIVASAVNGSAMPRSVFRRSLTSLSKTSKKKSENSEFPKKTLLRQTIEFKQLKQIDNLKYNCSSWQMVEIHSLLRAWKDP